MTPRLCQRRDGEDGEEGKSGNVLLNVSNDHKHINHRAVTGKMNQTQMGL